MKIEIKLVGRLKEYRESNEAVEISEGATVIEVLAIIGVPEDEAGMVALNGTAIARKDRATHRVEDGDSMTILAPVHGG
jgi:thiamine biosynthesis protein ThiS